MEIKENVKENSNNDLQKLDKLCERVWGVLILGSKGTCKTTLLQHLGRELRKNPKNRVILLETFPLHRTNSIEFLSWLSRIAMS